MPSLLQDCSAAAERLHETVLTLEQQAALLRLEPLVGREWFELLRMKLLPQLGRDTFLIAAVVGGTNIGKSVVFNMLAGSQVSKTSPNASGTKHPVCLIPPGFGNSHDLARIFDGFELRPWANADQALQAADEDLLFWDEGPQLPPNLLILDTPDIDSDARANWARAEKVRRAADVLITVLTQEKYNDAAVKQFFRTAATEEKAIIILFNKVELPDDETYWPQWLETFCHETRIRPEYIYLAPRNRAAVESLTLPFFERTWPAKPRTPAEQNGSPANRANDVLFDRQPRSLAADLSRLHFDEVKLRSLRGALDQLVDEHDGVPAWLREVTDKSQVFQAAAEHTSAERVVELRNWPALPFDLVFTEFWSWWKARRTGWSQNITGVYDAVRYGVSTPFRAARKALGHEPADPVRPYEEAEREAALEAAEAMFKRMKILGDAGGDLIRPHFESLATGKRREQFLRKLREEHEQVNIREELRSLIAQDMTQFLDDRPRVAKWLKRLDLVVVGSRPALSAALFFGGAAGVDVVAQPLIHIAVDLLAGTAATATGDVMVNQAAGNFGAALFARLRAIPTKFAAKRAEWLNELFHAEILGTLPEQLRKAASLPTSREYREVEQALSELRSVLLTAPGGDAAVARDQAPVL